MSSQGSKLCDIITFSYKILYIEQVKFIMGPVRNNFKFIWMASYYHVFSHSQSKLDSDYVRDMAANSGSVSSK